MCTSAISYAMLGNWLRLFVPYIGGMKCYIASFSRNLCLKILHREFRRFVIQIAANQLYIRHTFPEQVQDLRTQCGASRLDAIRGHSS